MTGAPGQPEGEAKIGARELALLAPNLAKLLWRLAKDKRVPFGTKVLVVGTAAYLAMPFDIIPDWLPGIGYLDDIALVGFTLHRLVKTVPPEVLQEHWDGAIPLPDVVKRLSFRKKSKRKRDEPTEQAPP
jgi:uncharacterized membrane protein YkvA (DUF1232 family)